MRVRQEDRDAEVSTGYKNVAWLGGGMLILHWRQGIEIFIYYLC